MREIVKVLLELIEDNETECFSIDSEWYAGVYFAKQLALASIDDTKLFSHYFLNTTPDHSSDGLEPLEEVIERHGWQQSTVSLLVAPFIMETQHAGEIFTFDICNEINEFLQNDANADAFFKLLAEWSAIWVARSLPVLFENVLDKLLGVSKNTDTDKLVKEYVKLARAGKTPGKAELTTLVAKYSN